MPVFSRLSFRLFKTVAIVLCGSLLVSGPALSQTQPRFGLGAVLDPDAYATVRKAAPLARGDYFGAPPAMSLRQYLPPVANQGNQGSCVGWATAYAARTLLKAKEIGAESGTRDLAMSPAYVFNQIALPGCNGSQIHKALRLMSEQGVAPLSEFPYDENSCTRVPDSSARAVAGDARIKDYNRLWGETGRNKHVATRRALSAGNPVVIGMMVGDSMMRYEGDGAYRPFAEEYDLMRDLDYALDTGKLGGHAMTVIGYDDNRGDGAFQIVNSWGRDWGEDGLFWLSYSDFNAFVVQGYEVVPLDPPPTPRVVDMGGSVKVLHMSGEQLTATRDGDGYRITRALPSGTRFRVEASSDMPGYIYVIGGDATGDYGALFPRGEDVSPHAPAGARLLLPGPTELHFTRLNDTTGTDYYVLLFAQERLDIEDIAQKLRGASGFPGRRLGEILGDRLVAFDDVELDAGGIGFEAVSGEADVVYLPLVIDHVEPSPANSDAAAPLIVLTNPALESFDDAASPDAPIKVQSRLFRIEGNAQDESLIASVTVDGALSSQFSSRGPFRAEIELPPGPGPHAVTVATRDAEGNAASKTFRFSVEPSN